MKLSIEEIDDVIKDYDRDTKALKEDLFKICWYMRGSISYSESLMLESSEREIISKIIKSNLETTKESGLPFF